ncbi:secreted RxLR effector protein 161-like [Pistacia vera]|uniref:secreted RxLR effector protein 161-like n=1 Tax=Pistacia vera TaxID=55513 RepID=UPI0012630DBC|nr:secreted RxLR effector protein 161-like [Pistacia vera]
MENYKSINTPLVQNKKLCKEDEAAKVDETKYRSMVGYLLYLTATRSDIMYAASFLSRFMNGPSEMHLKATKRVLRYIRGCADLGIWFRKAKKLNLYGYSDSDWGGSLDNMKSTSCYVFYLNSGAISWISKKQKVVAQSTTEVEYISDVAAVNQLIG